MRPKAFFDDGLFFMSFSIALGVIALIIPARGAAPGYARHLLKMNGIGAWCAARDLPAAPVAGPAASACTGMSDTAQGTLTGVAGSPIGREQRLRAGLVS
jgi:hypothetical protein